MANPIRFAHLWCKKSAPSDRNLPFKFLSTSQLDAKESGATAEAAVFCFFCILSFFSWFFFCVIHRPGSVSVRVRVGVQDQVAVPVTGDAKSRSPLSQQATRLTDEGKTRFAHENLKENEPKDKNPANSDKK